ncbi:hypothetical protein DSL72_002725 [Monilinia vaccinii-corymbosi]|uniref:Uncharacterized protein n=1 Tax=Monilinia vaccinii-corymbosi TaxID=61207 RepID=A0A8A3PDI6_9HELO|nr:hypothetical protein DSL72_002725 [Monilinia vaccinii-corymbosi]
MSSISSTFKGSIRVKEWTCCWCECCTRGAATSDHTVCLHFNSESVLPPPARRDHPHSPHAESGGWSLEEHYSCTNSLFDPTHDSFYPQIHPQNPSMHHDLEESLRYCGQQFGSVPVDSTDVRDSMTNLSNNLGYSIEHRINERTSPILNHSTSQLKQVTYRKYSNSNTSTKPLDCWSETPESHEYIAYRWSEVAPHMVEHQHGDYKNHNRSCASTNDSLRIPLESESFSSNSEREFYSAKDGLLAELTNMDQETASSGPFISNTNKTPPLESFINNPAPYFEDVSSLEERVLHFGNSTFENITRSHGQSVLSLPAFELDMRPFDRPQIICDPLSLNSYHPRRSSLPPSPLVGIEERVCISIRAGLETLSAIRGGMKLLHDEGFCSQQGYNIIVVDPNRPRVLSVRSISVPSLTMLDSLLREVGASELPQLEPILEDIAEILSHISGSLGLKMAVTNDLQEQREKWQGICQSLRALLAVLHIALMSFIRSHIDVSGAVPNGALSDGLQIEAPGGKICLAARRLQCLHGLLKQPVWAFDFLPTNSHPLKVDYDGFYISISIDDLAELWGPIRLKYAENLGVETAASVETRGGTILAVNSTEHSIRALDDETLCHWFGWLDISGHPKTRDKVISIGTKKRLLIGMQGLHYSGRTLRKWRIRPKLEVTEMCNCIDTYSLQYAEFELSTKVPSWTLDAKSLQASGGKYVTLTAGFTYKFNAGWTLKDAILESWIDAAKDDLSHIPNPHYMDYLVVIDVSRCSGHARRISLWKLLQCSDLRECFRHILEVGDFREIETALLQYASNDCFATIWPLLDTKKRNLLKFAFKSVLKTLRCTGVGEDGLLQVWDITSMPRIDGRRIDPKWAKLVQDDIGCATFAIITGTCRKYKPPVRAHDTPSTLLPVLHTQVCITAKQKLKQTEDTPKEWEVASNFGKSNLRGFSSKWGVSRSNSTNVRLGKSSDVVRANMEETLLEGIRARQKARQMTFGAARIVDSTDQSVLVESDQSTSSRYIITDDKQMCDNTRSMSSSGTRGLGTRRERLPEPALCDVNLSVRNGKGQKVGSLLLEPLQGPSDSIDLNSLTNTSALPATWQSSRPNLLEKLHEKEAAWDQSISSWARKSTGFISSLIGRIAPEKDLSLPDVIEYIRPGNLTAYQKVLTTYIR